MRRLLAALVLSLSAASPALAQGNGAEAIAEQQQLMQNLLNNAIVAIENNDQPQACALRRQAAGILATNVQGFEAVFPANNWSDLQTSLQGSLNSCAAKGY
jgi:cytochrome c556